MLQINIINDGTGTDASANYTYIVSVTRVCEWGIGSEVIGKGHIQGHNRPDGWRELVRMMIEQSEGDG